MINQSYIKMVESIRSTKMAENSSNLKRNAIVSASLFNLLPEIPITSHETLINNLKFHQQWTILDQNHVNLANQIEEVGDIQNFIFNDLEPKIYCSYHLGSYRLLIPYLIKKKVKFTILIDSAVASIQKNDFEQVIARSILLFDAELDCCRIVDTSGAGVIFSMLKELKRKRSLLIFVDGNTGVDSTRDGANNKIEIDFLGNKLVSRKGFAHISYLSGVSIQPLIMYRHIDDPWKNCVFFAPPLNPALFKNTEDYAVMAVRYVYQVLEEKLRIYYEQWESWFYIEQSLLLPNLKPKNEELKELESSDQLTFNVDRYYLASLPDGEFFLFDRKYYRTVFISEFFNNYLRQFVARKIEISFCLAMPECTESLLKKLTEKGILIHAS